MVTFVTDILAQNRAGLAFCSPVYWRSEAAAADTQRPTELI